MSKKFFLEDGSEVKFGDVIRLERVKKTGLGEIRRITEITVTSENIDKLIEKGIIAPKAELYVHIDSIESCLQQIAIQIAKPLDKVTRLYMQMVQIYPASALHMLLRTMAVNCNNKYDVAVEDLDRIAYVALTDGKVHTMGTEHIANWDNFAAFINVDDARSACKVLKPLLDIMYGKQED